METKTVIRRTINVSEFAKILGISKSLAYSLIKRGEIKYLKIGERRYLIPLEVVEKLIGEVNDYK